MEIRALNALLPVDRMKGKLLDQKHFKAQAEAKVANFDFIERFYNRRRRHSPIGQLSPVNLECRREVGA